MVTRTLGWGFGSSGGLYRTGDSGKAWMRVLTPHLPSGAFAFPYAYHSALWYVLPGSHGDVIVESTSIEGARWRRTSVATAFQGEQVSCTAMDFISPRTGWMIVSPPRSMHSQRGELFLTEDAGSTWTRVAVSSRGDNFAPGGYSPPEMPFAGQIAFSSARVGFLVGNFTASNPDELFRTEDAGRTWAQQSLPLPKGMRAPSPLAAPHFVSSTEAIMPVQYDSRMTVGFDLTLDAGLVWTTGPSLPVATSWFILDARHLWLLSQGRLYFSADAGRTWRMLAGLGLAPIPSQYATGKLFWLDPSHGWIILFPNAPTGSVRLLTTSDAGRTWRVP